MDTRQCDAVYALADRADLLVIESTFLSADAGLADRYGHLTGSRYRRVGDAPSECLDAHDPIKRTTVLAVTDGLAVLGGWLIFLSLLVALGVLLARPPS